MAKSESELTQNVTIRWAARVFVLGTLMLLPVLAVIEYRAQANSQASAEAWVDKHGETIGSNDFRLGVMEDLTKGNPSSREGKLSDLNDPRDSRSVLVYEWKGAFNTYAVYVGVLNYEGMEHESFIVETIEGPRKL